VAAELAPMVSISPSWAMIAVVAGAVASSCSSRIPAAFPRLPNWFFIIVVITALLNGRRRAVVIGGIA
jgi:hypothetical protein